MTKTRRLMASLPNVLRPAGRTKGKSFSVLGDEKSIIVRSVRQRFWVLTKLMRSGEFEKVYTNAMVSSISCSFVINVRVGDRASRPGSVRARG
jgi:hypothetical protein